MAELDQPASATRSEDRERFNRLRAFPDIGEGHQRPNPQLKSILDELSRHPKPERSVDDEPEAA